MLYAPANLEGVTGAPRVLRGRRFSRQLIDRQVTVDMFEDLQPLAFSIIRANAAQAGRSPSLMRGVLAFKGYRLAEAEPGAADALAYDGLVQSWPEIVRLAREAPAKVEPTEPVFSTKRKSEAASSGQ